jgi:hypothetical protein
MQEPRKTSWIGAGHLGEELDVVRVVRAGEDRLGDLGEVDLDHRGVLGVLVGLEQGRLLQPLLHFLDPLLEGVLVLVALLDHLLHQGDVGAQVGRHRLLGELDAAGGGAALGGGVGQLEGLLDGLSSGSPSISRMRPLKMLTLFFFGTVSRPCLIAQ